MRKKYHIRLRDEERNKLKEMTTRGWEAACKIRPLLTLSGAGDGIRTHDVLLGKQALYR